VLAGLDDPAHPVLALCEVDEGSRPCGVGVARTQRAIDVLVALLRRLERARLKPGDGGRLRRRTRAVWPELLDAIRAAGVTRWLIFRDGLELFHAMECDDYDRAIATLAPNPVNQRWQAEMARFTETAHDYSGGSADRLPLRRRAPLSLTSDHHMIAL
jgi:L-rhamnose mutarotase